MTTALYIRDTAVVARRIGDETVLVPVRRNVGDLESIYTLNGVAAALWDRLATPQTAEDLAASLASEYDVAPPDGGAGRAGVPGRDDGPATGGGLRPCLTTPTNSS